MSFRVSGKNIEVGEALRQRITNRVLESVGKYFEGGGFSGHATVGKEAFGFHTECVLHLDSGVVLRADSMVLAFLPLPVTITVTWKRGFVSP